MPVSGVLKGLLEYWQELPRTEHSTIPSRDALNPGELQELLPRLALLKRLDRYNVQASMINMSASHLWQKPYIGINAFDVSDPTVKEFRAAFYEAVLNQPAAAQVRETTLQKNGKEAFVKSLYLPLADQNGIPTYIAACSVYENKPHYNRINDRLIMDHHDVQELEFIDIGRGVPAMEFRRPAPRAKEDPALNWWQKIVMPSKARTGTDRHLDA